MSPAWILVCVAGYFAALLAIAWFTSRRADSAGYFLGNRASLWYVVAFGMISDTLSGVSFVSVPGQVGAKQFGYFQIVLGNVLGYAVIALVLLPLYYRLNLTSIYGYLGQRFGPRSQKTGAALFLVSRLLQAGARLFIAAHVFQIFLFGHWGVPFVVTVAAMIGLILLYTYRGGIKTLVWTDTFQSAFLLLGVLGTIAALAHGLNLDFSGLVNTVRESPHSQIFFWDWREGNFFWKQIIAGACLAVVMNGLDQNVMQKNLSCRTLREAQKNFFVFGGVVLLVNLAILSLGALLLAFAQAKGVAVPEKTDQLFPLLAFQHLGPAAAVCFVLGLTAATFSSADSVLTTLTTSFCVDILGMNGGPNADDRGQTRLRHKVHIGFAVLLLLVILAFNAVRIESLVYTVLDLATYTYGPLLGLFAFGLASRRGVRDRWVPLICLAAPLLCWLVKANSAPWFGGYKLGFELLILNGALTAAGLCLLREEPGFEK